MRRRVLSCDIMRVVATLVIVAIGVGAIGCAGSSPAERSSEEFEKLYQQWRDFRATPKGAMTWIGNVPPRREICKLGPQVIDDIMAKLPDDFRLIGPLRWISGGGPTVEELRAFRTNEEVVNWWLNWWEEGQAGENRRFEENYARGDLVAIRRQGIGALPKIMEKLRAGDTDLLPIMRSRMKIRAQIPRHSELVPLVERLPEERGQMSPAEAREAAAFCLKWWEENKEKWLIPFPDQQYD